FIFTFMMLFSLSVFSNQDELDFNTWEKTGGWGIYYKKPDNRFNPLEIKKYEKYYLPSLSYLINSFDMKNEDNKYCLIGYQFHKTKGHDEFESVIIFWENANYLIDWVIPDSGDNYNYKAILFSKPFIDMKDSVVPYKEAEGAQALWAKEGVIQMMEDCEFNGQKITIKPSEVIDVKD
ncbi:hypothetical protein, partial [Xenorhabdus sp. PB30.3]|uniref:hypothetical protein n=1 Tax=Xenorhabdus sp. PB30.3 TaxID=2788941 RepID=UPI001E659086